MPVFPHLYGVRHATLNQTLMTGSMTSPNTAMEDTPISNPRPTTGAELSELNIKIDWLRANGSLPLGVIPLPPKPQPEPEPEPYFVERPPGGKPWGY